jgi:predicted O-methyltransferase YrrM
MKWSSFTPANLREKGRQLHRRWLASRYALPAVELADLAPPDTPVAPPILDHICMPPHYYRQDHDDFTPLMKLARARQPKIIVELGTAHGNTTANLCRHCPGARVFTVNAPVEEMTGAITTFGLRREEIGSVYRQHGFAAQVTQIYANTLRLDLAPHLHGQPVDLGIVDACHDTEYVLNDFQKLRPHLAPQGLILLHDTHPSMEDHLMGSYVACLKLRQQGFDVRWLRDTWWAVWQPSWPAPVRRS